MSVLFLDAALDPGPMGAEARALRRRKFVNSRNPVAAKMKIAERDRPRVKVECLRLMVTLTLDPARMRLIASFVDTYLSLTEAQDRRFTRSLAEAKLLTEQRGKVVEIVTSWERKGIEKGRQEGRQELLEALRAVLLDVLTSRFGPPDESVAVLLRGIDSIADLRALIHRALTEKSLPDVGL